MPGVQSIGETNNSVAEVENENVPQSFEDFIMLIENTIESVNDELDN